MHLIIFKLDRLEWGNKLVPGSLAVLCWQCTIQAASLITQ